MSEQEMAMELHPIFAECCTKEAGFRYAIDRSWVKGGFALATDGRICVRSSTTEPDTDGVFPPTSDLGWARDKSRPFLLPDPLPEMNKAKCDRCDGDGVDKHRMCEACYGEGIVECDMGHDHDCEECNGTGEIKSDTAGKPCGECDGTGKVDDYTRVEVGVSGISLHYATILKRHGCVLYEPKKSTDPIYFTFAGGEGLLMPLAPKNGSVA